MRSQLDFFKAEVVAFPFDRRRAEVIRAAKFLNVVHGEFAERGWKRICKDMAKRMRAAGLSEAEIRSQAVAFQNAVQGELRAMMVQQEKQA